MEVIQHPVIRVIILAAGASERMGQPKQLLQYNGKSLIQHIVQAANDALHIPPLVVTGKYDRQIRDALAGQQAEFVFNPEWESGMASSIRCGLQHVLQQASSDGVLLAVSDQPFVTSLLITSLVNKYRASVKPITVCRYADQTLGTPALFGNSLFSRLLELKGQEGAGILFRNHRELVEAVDFPLGGIDIDTPEDYSRLLENDANPE